MATPPIPAAKTTLPPLSTSSVATWWASTCGRRRGTGVTFVPSTSVEVLAATAASATHGSHAGGPQTKPRWSQISSASQPDRSASSASRDHRARIGIGADVGKAEAVTHRRNSTRVRPQCRRGDELRARVRGAPRRLRAWGELLGAIKANMDLRRYELATLAAARRLRSSYCSLAHGKVLIEQYGEPVVEIVTDRESAGLDEVDLAVMDLAERVVDDATTITDADLQRLRDLGLTDPEIMDVILAAAVRCFWTKTLDALGVQPDASYPRARRPSSGRCSSSAVRSRMPEPSFSS